MRIMYFLGKIQLAHAFNIERISSFFHGFFFSLRHINWFLRLLVSERGSRPITLNSDLEVHMRFPCQETNPRKHNSHYGTKPWTAQCSGILSHIYGCFRTSSSEKSKYSIGISLRSLEAVSKDGCPHHRSSIEWKMRQSRTGDWCSIEQRYKCTLPISECSIPENLQKRQYHVSSMIPRSEKQGRANGDRNDTIIVTSWSGSITTKDAKISRIFHNEIFRSWWGPSSAERRYILYLWDGKPTESSLSETGEQNNIWFDSSPGLIVLVKCRESHSAHAVPSGSIQKSCSQLIDRELNWIGTIEPEQDHKAYNLHHWIVNLFGLGIAGVSKTYKKGCRAGQGQTATLAKWSPSVPIPF